MNVCPHCQGLITEPMARFGLTAAQADALVFIRDFVADNDFSPSFDEIKAYLGLRSKSGVHRIIKALEFRGYVQTSYGRARSIVLMEAS